MPNTTEAGKTRTTHGPKGRAGRIVRAAGMTTTAMAGALTLVITTPRAAADGFVDETSSWQPAFENLLDEMHQAVTHDAALPYAPPGSEDELLTILQNTNYQILMTGISRVTELFNGWFFQSPEVVAGDAANPRQYFDFFTPDIYYHVTAGLAPGATYQLTGTLGDGTEHFSISTLEITAGTAEAQSSVEVGDGLTVNPDGTFSIVIGPTEPSGAVNYLDDSDATSDGAASLLIRDMLGNWAQGPTNIGLDCIDDCPPFFSLPDSGLLPNAGASATEIDPLAALSDTKIDSIDSLLTTLFNAFAEIIGPFNERAIAEGESAGVLLDPNTMSDLAPESGFGAGLESAVVSAGNFDLDPGEALIVQMPNVPTAYSGIELMNVFGAALPYVLSQTTLNNTQAFHADDGYTYYVVSSTNPDVANWLDSSGVTRGEIFARFEGIADGADPVGLDVSTQVVPVDEVTDYLPAGTPTVTPAEYAADMTERVLTYDYALDVSRMHAEPDWLIQEWLLHALEGLMGSDNFEAAFGSEPSTPMELRLTPALSPDWDAVADDVFTNPAESLSAIVDNLPLAWSDITLPIELAMTRTVLAPLIPGFQLDDVFHDALLDPNTSITAGLLNARDDLATAVLTANDGFPSQLGKLATLEWQNMSELTQPDSNIDLADLTSLLDPADLFGI